MENRETDWTRYYEGKKSIFSAGTQRITYRLLKGFISQYAGGKEAIHIAELGGGNSCFAENMYHDFCIRRYTVIDNNQLGCELARKKGYEAVCMDLTEQMESRIETMSCDIVYSIGLVEHFMPEIRSRVIENHFKLCKEGGIVIISFPTPTLQYRIIRKLMEWLSVWQFWDEMPFWYDEIKRELSSFGEILEYRLNSRLPLTQTLVVVKRKG